jgi:hypothetical protein
MIKIPIHYHRGRCPECDKAGFFSANTMDRLGHIQIDAAPIPCKNVSICIHPDEAEVDYYQQDPNILSNSELGRIKDEMMGRSPGSFSEETKRFGRWFHTALLEPMKWHNQKQLITDSKAVNQISRMVRNARRSEWLCHLLDSETVQIEHEYFFELFGVPFKAKIDARLGIILADPKSTSCTNLEAFQKACIDYGYYRQGTIYLHGTGASQFYLVGISKTTDAAPFIVPVHEKPGLMAQAWEETEKIVNFHKMTQYDTH